MYRYLLRDRLGVVLYLVLAPLSAACALGLSAGMAAAMDYAAGGELADVWKYLAAFGAYILLDLAVDQTFKMARLRLSKRAMTALRLDVYHHISRMECLRFFQRSTADYMADLTADMEIVRESYYSVLLGLYSNVIRLAAASAALFWLSPVLGGFVLATSAIQTVVPVLFAGRLERAGAAFSATQEGRMAALKEGLSAFLTARTFHIEAELEGQYDAALERTEEQKRRLGALTAWAGNLSFVFSQVTRLGIFLLGAVLALKGLLSAGAIVGASQLMVYISNPIYTFNASLSELKSAKASIQKLTALLREPEDEGGTVSLTEKSGDLRAKDLNLRYGQREIISGLSAKFTAGGKYLIVGSSGSGKSTLLDLLAGLRRDYSGSITLGGIELRELTGESRTGSICYLSQEPYLFDDTLYNNVCLFSGATEERVRRVLAKVGLQLVVDALPDGIYSRVGENAATLSGGEKQRVGIARALLRGTPILLLDESTSHLDPDTAADIERLVLELEGVTVVLVSHNATDTARTLADAVLQMEQGKLRVMDVPRGTG